MPRQVKIAVVGSGLAGLTASHLLTQAPKQSGVEFEVHLFEKSSSIGIDSSSISVGIPEAGIDWRVDVPMRSFQGGYYAQLIALYKKIGIPFRQSNFSYSFSSLSQSKLPEERVITTSLIYNGASGRQGLGMPSLLRSWHQSTKASSIRGKLIKEMWLFALFVILTFKIALCFAKTILHSIPILRSPNLVSMRFGEWIEQTEPKGLLARCFGFDTAWRSYSQDILIPLFSAVCSAPEEDILDHPAEEFLDYCWMTFGTHHYTVFHGVRNVAEKLTANLHQIHLSTRITGFRPDSNNERLISIVCGQDNGPKVFTGFHHIIIATQANQAVPLLKTYLAALPAKASCQKRDVENQIRCLSSFRYCSAIVINHTDHDTLPNDPKDRRDLNFVTQRRERVNGYPSVEVSDERICMPQSYTMATHILHRPKGYPTNLPEVLQTTNPIILPKEQSIISRTSLQRALLTMEGKKALNGLYKEGSRRWWQCAVQAKSRLGPLQGAGRFTDEDRPGIWICGAYAHAGIPLLEGCVVSARSVVEQGVFQCEGVTFATPPW